MSARPTSIADLDNRGQWGYDCQRCDFEAYGMTEAEMTLISNIHENTHREAS